MKKYNWICSALAVVLCFGLNAKTADAALVGDPAVVFGWSSAGAGTDTMRGWQFSTNSPIEVTALGVFDHWNPDGLIGEHEVVIWDSNNQIVTQATVPAGIAATKIGGTRYIEITPVILVAGQTFLIGSQHINAGRDDWFAHSFNTLTFDPAITFIEGRYLNTIDLLPPTTVFANPLIGPNLLMNVIPEPATVGLLAAGGLFMMLRRKR
jgi:hypothetical protein